MLICFSNPTVDFIKFPQYYVARWGSKYPFHMNEVLNALFMFVVPFTNLLQQLFANWNASQQKIFYIFIQIFRKPLTFFNQQFQTSV